MKPMQEIEQEIIEEFNLFDDPIQQYEYLIDLGNKLPPMDDALKTDENIIEGCTSTVWLHSRFEDGKVHYQADSNTVITKGMIALLLRVLNGREPGEIVNAPLDFLKAIDLSAHLTEQRSNGLQYMIERIRSDARRFMN